MLYGVVENNKTAHKSRCRLRRVYKNVKQNVSDLNQVLIVAVLRVAD